MIPYLFLDTLIEVRDSLQETLDIHTTRLVTDGRLRGYDRERVTRAVGRITGTLDEINRLIAERSKP